MMVRLRRGQCRILRSHQRARASICYGSWLILARVRRMFGCATIGSRGDSRRWGLHAARQRHRSHPQAGNGGEAHAGQPLRHAGSSGLFLSFAPAASRKERSQGPRAVQRTIPLFVQRVKDAIAPHGGKVRVFFMDQAGWHKSKQLKLPSNIIPARRDCLRTVRN